MIEVHAIEPLMEVVDEAVDKVVMPVLTVIIVDLPTHLLDLFFPSSQESKCSHDPSSGRGANSRLLVDIILILKMLPFLICVWPWQASRVHMLLGGASAMM